MNSIKIISTLLILLTFNGLGFSQNNNYSAAGKAEAAVLGIDVRGLSIDATSAAYMARLELEKTNIFTVMDKYDVADALKKQKIDPATCFGKTCLVQAGRALKADKMLSGSVESFGDKIVVTMRLIDVESGAVEKSDAMEYLDLEDELQKMIGISVRNILGLETDPNLVNLLIEYDSPVSSPKTTLQLSGPRMGASMVLGEASKRLQDSKDNGGYEMLPVTSQFGYQYEVQYLSAGNFQALIEFVGLVGGLESGKFIPSLSFLNGFRGTRSGWEFAFGPTFKVGNYARGYYDTNGDGKWHLASEWNADPKNMDAEGNIAENPHTLLELPDHRGATKLSTNLVLAVGKTFKSGYLNIPVNVYVIPSKKGSLVGASFGFNINRKPDSKK